jgi:ribosome-associated translation inhibitor RaiA
MTIQFNLPQRQVKEWVISYLMNKLMMFHNLDRAIIRAEVNLKEVPNQEKHCDINLTIPGDSLYASQNAATFEEAALHALNMIEQRLIHTNHSSFPLIRKFHAWRIKKFA